MRISIVPATSISPLQEVANLLGLSTRSGDAEVRKALLAQGLAYVVWYDTRLRAIDEFERGSGKGQLGRRGGLKQNACAEASQ